MENLLRRLKYYGIGFGIGLVFVIVLFRQKGCSWTPGNRVKTAILERIVFVDSLDMVFLKTNKITPKKLKKYILHGTVSFMDSKRSGNEKIYHFNGTLGKNNSFNCLLAYRENSAVVDVDFLHDKPQDYKRLEGNARPFLYTTKNWFSGKLDLLKVLEKGLPVAPEKFTQLFFSRGTLNADCSNLDVQKPICYLNYPIGSDSVHQNLLLKTTWFQEKIEILYVTTEACVARKK